ncbi:MAG TPA: GNAT family N-acetyltransferase, partial [Myxococcota bacterium]|nr:GNAT family N-acetyltransferase [Myxococcota bacterium]
ELSAELYRLEGLAAQDVGRERAMAELIAHPELGAAWLIRADGCVAGYVVLTVCYSLEFHGRFGLLDELYLEEAWRGKGTGKAALAFVDDECRQRGLKAVRLEVGHANARALELYRRSGYRVAERHLMTKWL